MRWLLRQLSNAVRILVIGVLTVALGTGVVALANYTLTQGAGTTFGSVVIGGTTHYVAHMLCDFTVGVTQCAAVDANGTVRISNDPCTNGLKSFAPINLTASGQIITGTASKKTYICNLNVVTAAAQNIALVEGTGTTCATNIFGLAGSTTAATGWNFAANSGLSTGAGVGSVFFGSGDANATAANVCLLLSGSGQTSGTIGYVQQ